MISKSIAQQVCFTKTLATSRQRRSRGSLSSLLLPLQQVWPLGRLDFH